MANTVLNTLSTIGASKFATEDRQQEDYYATDPIIVQELLKVEDFHNEVILEPCCGEGHISKVLEKAGYNVTSFDLHRRGFGEQKDFFEITHWEGDIITNPPYKEATKFVKHALEISDNQSKVVFLLRLLFLEGIERHYLFKQYPPKTVYVFSNRQLCAKNGDFSSYKGRAIAYAWFVWDKTYKGKTHIEWLLTNQ